VPKLKINGIEHEFDKGVTVLEAARFLGLPIPTLCHEDGLSPAGACRLCVVEVTQPGSNGRSKLLSSCTTPIAEGMIVQTHSARVEKARMLLLEMYVAVCPDSKRIQDMAAAAGLRQCRFEPDWDNHCIQCGLCVRICEEQMMAGAIGFGFRGNKRKVMRAFDMTSEKCRQCGACLNVCPVCEERCQGSTATTALCDGCVNISTVCYQSYDNAMCSLDPCHACELPGPFRQDVPIKVVGSK
jgi:bidirectional [NiFe] hydrogenase diaphorase subunit